ncbi:MAG: 16S rRNA (cytosine(1402)-N(4))-methyltransferase RsmH [Spirochaetaceae bacterium]|nr:MAG: 16S rRNA (cytosine(1402)-N(4))-methyltransferase RsmH [Spirochaetaceae bacterium]
MNDVIHVPVMPDEVVRYLAPPAGGLIVDATLGEGGHSALLLEASPRAHLVGLDADATMVERAARRLAPYAGRTALRNVWFDEYFASESGDERPAAVLLDLGISMYHYRFSGRGFSFSGEERLDMRLNEAVGLSAADICNGWPERQIADLIFEFGEERLSRRIAAAICRERRREPIHTAHQLSEIVFLSVPVSYRHGRIHPATRTFQALRIVVNDELGRLQRALCAAIRRLAPGGRLGVISFHSLEDRIVKQTFRAFSAGTPEKQCMETSLSPMSREGRDGAYSGAGAHSGDGGGIDEPVRILTKKPLVPSDQECRENPASRSAKFRVLEKALRQDAVNQMSGAEKGWNG